MLSVKDEELSQAEMLRYYAGLLVHRLNLILEAWDAGDLEEALARAIRTAYILTRDMKVNLFPDIEAITKEMNATYNVQSYDFYSTQLAQNKAARRVAQKWLPQFVDKLTNLCDDKGYFEKLGIQPKYKKEGKLGVPE